MDVKFVRQERERKKEKKKKKRLIPCTDVNGVHYCCRSRLQRGGGIWGRKGGGVQIV